MPIGYFQLIKLKKVSDPHLSKATCMYAIANQTNNSSIQKQKVIDTSGD